MEGIWQVFRSILVERQDLAKALGTEVHVEEVSRMFRFLQSHVSCSHMWGQSLEQDTQKGYAFTVALAVSLVLDMMKMSRFGHSQ